MSKQVPPQFKTTFGTNVKAAREAAGLTQRALGDLLEVEGLAVSRWERGEVTPTGKNLAALCAVLGCEPAWLYTDHALAA